MTEPPAIKESAKIRKTAIAKKKRILATPAVAAETPENPKNPATTEITKKMIVHFNIP
jgi:hypothetical protein